MYEVGALKYPVDTSGSRVEGERRPRRTTCSARDGTRGPRHLANGPAPRVALGLAVAGPEVDSTSARVCPLAPEGGVSHGIALCGAYWILLVRAPLCGRGQRQPRDRPLRRLLMLFFLN
mgnify:CR=1 FL=1